jgi:two-component system sensor histidine kinase BaeS
MRGLFARTILSFAAALAVLLAVLAAAFTVGIGRSLEEWERQKATELERYALAVLEGRPPETAPPVDTPLFVYGEDRALLWSNRGRGRNVGESQMIPLAGSGGAKGYYYTGGVHFGGDAANQRLLASLRGVVGLGSAVSAAVALLFALYFAARLSRPARSVAAGLDRISGGNLSEPIPEAGATEIAAIARAANRLQRQLAAEREIRKQWAQDVAHDLRTPIAAIKAQLEGMRDGVLQPTAQRIERTWGEVERVERLVAGLDELTRLESPEMRLAPVTMDAGRLLEDCADLWAARAADKRLVLERHAAVGTFAADDGLVRRALANLLSNAIRHADPDSVVRLEVALEPPWIVLRVANRGPVIPEEELERVFERLYRGEYARSTPGSGLGLTIARRIAELHGGTVTLRSSADAGTVAEMRLRCGLSPDPR